MNEELNARNYDKMDYVPEKDSYKRTKEQEKRLDAMIKEYCK